MTPKLKYIYIYAHMSGYRQSIAMAIQQELGRPQHPDQGERDLVTKLLSLYTSGHVSVTACQEVFIAATLDGLDHPEVALLAAMGAAGTQPGNIARDLQHFLGKDCRLPKPFDLKVPCMEPHSLTYTIEDVSIVLPQMMFSTPCRLQRL